MVHQNVELTSVIQHGTLGTVIFKKPNGQYGSALAEHRVAFFIALNLIGSEVDLGITSYGTVGVVADAGELDPEGDFDV